MTIKTVLLRALNDAINWEDSLADALADSDPEDAKRALDMKKAIIKLRDKLYGVHGEKPSTGVFARAEYVNVKDIKQVMGNEL